MLWRFREMRVCPKDFVKDYSIRSLVCSFSGGKDSLVATHYVLSELKDMNMSKYVVHANTGCMLTITQPFVEKVCLEFGWNLKTVYGHFFEHVKNGMPMPTIHRRWCCGICKLNPIHDFVKNLPPQRAEVTGLRSDESIRRKKMKLPELFYLRKSHVWKYAPILSWSEKDVQTYIRKNDLPMPPHYRLGLKETCMCGAYSSKKQMEILRAQDPQLFQKFVDIESKFKTGGACFYFNNKPKYARDFLKQKTLLEMGI